MSRPVVQEDGSCQFNLEQPFQKCQTGTGKVTFAPFAMESTIVTEFQLICDDSWLVRITALRPHPPKKLKIKQFYGKWCVRS